MATGRAWFCSSCDTLRGWPTRRTNSRSSRQRKDRGKRWKVLVGCRRRESSALMVAVERRMSRPLVSRSMVNHGGGMVIHIASSGTQRRKMLVRVYVQAQPTRRGHSRDCVNRQQAGNFHFYAAPLRANRVRGLTGVDAFTFTFLTDSIGSEGDSQNHSIKRLYRRAPSRAEHFQGLKELRAFCATFSSQ